MLFTQIEFFIFAGVVLALLRVTRSHRHRKILLLLGSYYFYAYWDWRFLPLLLATTLVNYLIALGLARMNQPGRRKLLLLTSLACNLGVLGFFKYFNFFVQSLDAIFGSLGLHYGTLRILLPIGISFYTFQILGYIIDVYRTRLDPCTDLLDFALFVAFFPRLVAGPIVRASEFLPQLRLDAGLSWHGTFVGFRQLTIGLFKKLFIADRVAVFVDYVFENAGAFDGVSTWLAVLAYGLQVYCDFSGYSDIAIGTARILGYSLPTNFRAPYLATSVTDFWHRWHISLSTWLRDYLYIPLGGNRKGAVRTYVNLFVTMVLGGLWHGASWTFVLWGALHGMALVAEKWLRRRFGPAASWATAGMSLRILGWFATMLIVFTAWVFFRAASFSQALRMLRQMYGFSGGLAWYHPFALFALLSFGVGYSLMAMNVLRLHRLAYNRLVTPVVLFSMWWLMLIFPASGFNPFVYAQF
ncbi:MAG: MBOAT family protein [Sedimentisphaerales bacterium]|nr:MBOAT family protein [Sedimentisphaerales bacterium]